MARQFAEPEDWRFWSVDAMTDLLHCEKAFSVKPQLLQPLLAMIFDELSHEFPLPSWLLPQLCPISWATV